MRNSGLQRSLLPAVVLLIAGLVGQPASAGIIYNGVAAGDMSSSDAILWTRADNGGLTTALTALVSTDPTFTTGVKTFTGSTNAAADFTLKLNATSLTPNTQYYYRFTDGTTTSPVGSFTTPAQANQATGVRFGFSGDADGRFRPYTLMNGFGTASQAQSQHLSFFTFLGDTMYETASTGSPAVTPLTSTSNSATVAQALADYQRKYRENVQGVGTPAGTPNQTSGQQGLQSMLAATGTYTVLDNHELGNVSLQSGGAPLAAGARVTPGQGFDVNTTGAFDNQTAAFKALQKAFFDYHPTRAGLDANLNSIGPVVMAPTDARSNGTPLQYFAQQEGKNAIYIQLDDRTYRDARLGLAAAGDDVTSTRRFNPDRTMLGTTQLAWAKQTLLDAQNAGTPWKFVVISTPIDQTGPAQDGKSWLGGYTAERNDLLKFIADNKIQNVVFLTTDDHLARMTALTYLTNLNDPNSARVVPGAFQIVAGPIGAGGPDAITDHSFANLQSLLDATNSGLQAFNEPKIGLCGFTGLSNEHRQGDNDISCSGIEFFSPDTFNYSILDVSQDGSSLTVDIWGIPSYQQNTFPQDAPEVSDILGFTLQAGFLAAVPAPDSLALLAVGFVGLALIRRALA